MGENSFIIWGILCSTFITSSSAGCSRALGMESREIHDDQITASSKSSQYYRPALARLGLKRAGGGWCPSDDDQHPYLQIDLRTPHTLTSISTQGANSDYQNRIQKFRLSYSYGNKTWYNYTINGSVEIFEGNDDPFITLPFSTKLPKVLTARAFRIHPIIVDKAVTPCARVELIGCLPSEDCKTPVGVEDRRITDKQITASSHFNEHYASNGRLNNDVSTNSNGSVIWGGWCTDSNDKTPYLQIDMEQVRALSGVATQGYMNDIYVTSYSLNYSTDGRTWQSYKENGPKSGTKVFQGNWDTDTPIPNMFARRIYARFIRFNPIASHGGLICMRVEVYECQPTKGSVPRVSPPSGTVALNRTSSVNLSCLVTGQAGARVEWYRNRQRLLRPPFSPIRTIPYGNGSVESVLTLSKVKYKDRGTIMSCSAWYPSLAINSTRNVLLLVHAPRPVVVVSDVQSRKAVLHVRDPSPTETVQYLVRYKTYPRYSTWVEERRNKTGHGADTWIVLHNIHPYSSYTVEVASYYKDDDVGPYSVNKHFTTKQAAPSGPPRDVLVIPRGKNSIRVSWSIPSARDCNGKITKYEIAVYNKNGDTRIYLSGEKTLSMDVTGLEKNQRFLIGVRAYTKVGPGPYSQNQSYSTEVSQGSRITQALEKLNKVPVTNKNAHVVTKEVRNITSKPSKLLQNDLSVTAKILDKVVKTNVTSVDVGDNVLRTISQVMDASPEVLEGSQRGNNKSARFVRIIEDYIDKGGKFSKGTSNIGVHTQVISKASSNIGVSVKATHGSIAINKTQNATSLDSDASISVPGSILTNGTGNTTLIVVYYRNSKLFAPEYRRAEVCEHGFTKEKVQEVEKSGASSYTMENSTGSRITTSSPVLSASLRNKQVSNLTKPVIIKFKMPADQVIMKSTRCVWWDFKKRGWSTDGCSLRGIVNDTIICECNHMTNFAALVDIDGPSSKACGKHSTALSLISYVGCALSILGLSLTIFTFAFFKKLRKDQIAAKILLHLCASLLCVLIVFVAGVERGTVSENACLIVAALVHYFLLVAFLWMLIEAYFMYQAFVKVFRDFGEHVMWKCSAFGWGVPFIVVFVTVAVDRTSYGGKHYCRIGDIAFFAAFAAPVAFVMLVNTITFFLIMYKLTTRPPNTADLTSGSEGVVKVKRAFGILILVGITWVFGFFAIADARLVFHYLFAVCNSLQGFAIFVFYCVIQRKVRECWKALLTCDLGRLKKSRSLFTDSYYDRRRLSSASRNQLDTMRPRVSTGMSQVQITLPRDQHNPQPDVVQDCLHHSNIIFDDDCAYPRLRVESSDYQLNEMSASQTICTNDSWDDHSLRFSYRGDSGSPSLRSRGLNIPHSQNSSARGTPASSAPSTPKMLRSPRIHPVEIRKGPRESTLRLNPPLKETLKRTASHTPESSRPTNQSLLRRTKSASLSLEDLRFSADFSMSSDQTSCESLSSEAATPTMEQFLDVPLREQIVGPIRGSIRGFVGYVETTVENFDLLIDLEKLRSSAAAREAYGV